MRVLIHIRQVPDVEENLRLSGNAFDLSSSKLVMDTMDEYGVEEALRMRENGGFSEIVVVAVGAPRLTEVLKTALALGVDRAIHVETEVELDPIALSRVVAVIAREEQAELILTGGQQADWDSQALGAAIAERMRWPQITWATQLTLEGRTLTGVHDIEDGTESFSVELPVVITTQQGLNEPRYPTLPGIMKARKKEIRKDEFARFEVVSSVSVQAREIQNKERLHKILDGRDARAAATELVSLLRQQAGVIV